jgi:serpin B
MRRLTLRLLPLLLCACPSTPGPDAATPAKAPPAAPKKTSPEKDSPKAPTPATPETPTPEQPVTTPTPTPDTPPAPTASPEVVAEVAAGFNTFGVELYREIAAAPGDQVISPASVAVALAMTHAGARGDTAKEMEAALHVTRPAADLHAAVGTMLTSWNAPGEAPEHAPPRAELSVANRLFGEATMPYEAPFLETTRTVFAAPLDSVDFKGAHEAARIKINDWVEAQTHDRIQELLPPGAVDASTRLVLVNAIYFKSQWMEPFQEHDTKPAPFFAEGKRAHDVPTMNATDHFSFAEITADGVQVVELRYGDPGFSMVVVVPLEKDGLSKVEAALTADKLAGWTGALTGERIALSLPKFRIAPADALRLSGALGKLGIRKVFGAEADLTGIAPASEQLQLAEAYHKGFIAVDEKGTEAAAATAMGMRAGGMPAEPRVVKVDRPFLYLVRDTRSGLVMFMGRVVDPKLGE